MIILPVIYAGLGVALFTSLVFIIRRPFNLVNKIIILFMIFLSVPMLVKLGIFGLIPERSGAMDFIRAFPFVFGPFLYLYARIMTNDMVRFELKNLLHFTPFIAALVMLIMIPSPGDNFNGMNRPPEFENHIPMDHPGTPGFPRFNGGNNNMNADLPPERMGEHFQFDRGRPDHFPGVHFGHPDKINPAPGHLPMRPVHGNRSSTIPGKIVISGVIISFVFYTIIILILLRRHYKKISDYFSYNTIMLNLGWLKWITISFFIAYGFVFVASVLSPAYFIHPLLNPIYTPDLGSTFFIITFGIFAMQQPAIFNADRSIEKSEESADEKSPNKNERRYEKSGLKDSDAEIFIKKLEDHMKTEKPYLNPDLTIVELSEKLNIPKHYVTEIINKKFDKNFFMYINWFRIEEAKKKISDENYSDHSILRIAYDCGFNSKSTFNNVFKKFTSQTPTDFRHHAML